METRVWFNHWFSQVYRLIELLKREEEGRFKVVGTNEKDGCVYKTVCDEFYTEPAIKDDNDYIEWCLEFCKTQRIDVFIPRRKAVVIAKNLESFDEIGVKVLVHRGKDLLSTLENKSDTSRFFKDLRICKVPLVETAENIGEFQRAVGRVKELISDDEKVCFKYSIGEGGLSFRVLDEAADGVGTLLTGKGSKVSMEDAETMLGAVERFDEIMVMPYMDGIEISIDSLMTRQGFIGVARKKIGGRLKEISMDEKMLAISKRFAEATGLTCPYNLQLRYYRGEPHLLEVNARMAGGTYMSDVLGVNFPYIAVKELLGESFKMPETTGKVVTVSQIETMVKIEMGV